MDGADPEEVRDGKEAAGADVEAAPAPEAAEAGKEVAEAAAGEGGKDAAEDGAKDGAKDGAAQEGAKDAEPAQEGTKAAEEGKVDEDEPKVTATKKEDEDGAKLQAAAAKPSYTLHIRSLPDDLEMSELEMRLKRYGDVVSVVKEEGMVVAKFTRTNEAYKAREKLNGTSPFGDTKIQVDFGPQDAEHYNRGKKRMLGKARREVTEEVDEGAGKKEDDKPEEPETGAAKRRKVDAGGADIPKDTRGKGTFALTAPTKPVSRWSEELTFEEQLEDFMRMPRHGMYNRYLVIGKLPPELRTGEAIWRAMHPVQRDIVQIEMLLCFGKPVAHVALRSATTAAAMHRLCEQMHASLTVAFAPPRRSSCSLWLGNVDDFVARKELEALLLEYGRVTSGLRYLPARTCAFITFQDAADAIAARNALYGLEVQRSQFLNVDFVDESDHHGQDQWGGGMWGGPWGAPAPWAAPWPRPWGPPVPAWGAPGQQRRGRGDDRWRGNEQAVRPPMPHWGMQPAPFPGRSPPRQPERAAEKRGKRRHTRSRSHARHSDREASQERERGRRREASAHRPRSPSETAEPRNQKARVKLYKMGEFCCNIVANYVRGKEGEAVVPKLHIDQRTKVDHCRSHLERAGSLATVWHFSAADRRDCAAYDALCDYFVEKQRVGLVQTPNYYVYIVPPTEQYLKDLGLPSSNFVVGLQIPIKK